jgi:hypothetical protein
MMRSQAEACAACCDWPRHWRTLICRFRFHPARDSETLPGRLADDNLFRDADPLGDHRLLASFFGLDGALLERLIGIAQGAVGRAVLNGNVLLTKCHLLVDRGFHHIRADANPPVTDITHADPQPLFHDWKDLLAAIRQTDFGTGQARFTRAGDRLGIEVLRADAGDNR